MRKDKPVFAEFSGIKEIRRGLLKSDKQLAPEIRKVFKATAEIAASEARSRMVSDGAVLSGVAKKSIKAGTSGANATIRGGTNEKGKVPYYGWLDFGGTIRPRGTPIVRDVIKTPGNRWNGRYIYPAMRDKVEEAARFLNDRITELVQKNIK
jgi:hypothetical protein